MVESRDAGTQPGWREVLLVAVGVVAAVFAAVLLTGLLPTSVQDIVYRTPLAIVLLIGGTGWWLWRISRRGPSKPDR